ncbi:hypothetical protein JCM10207_005541, partial [Rhodosporidiobolus poonsookiae]
SIASDTPSPDCVYLEHSHDRAAYKARIDESTARREQRAAAAATASVPLPANELPFETEDDGNEDWREQSLEELHQADAAAAAARTPEDTHKRERHEAEVAEREKAAKLARKTRAAAADAMRKAKAEKELERETGWNGFGGSKIPVARGKASQQ